MNSKERIRQYWEDRALNTEAATTDDVYLRELEIITIVDTIKRLCSVKSVLDIGCGDGYSTIKIAEALDSLSFLGIDYSKNMVKLARGRLTSNVMGRVAFSIGDVMDLRPIPSQFDIVLTDRCLINLESTEAQNEAIEQIAQHIKQGGYFVAIENFVEGQHNMNEARRAVGLPEIPVRWHNLYFEESEFLRGVCRYFEVLGIHDFSSAYYFATRVIYSKMCQMRGETPDYRHEIHQLAVNLPAIGQFSPIRMVVLRRNG